VSTKEQAEKGWSIEGQYADLRAYCSRVEGYKVVRVIKDPGYTGTNMDRPGLQRLLYYADCGAFDTLILWKFDRLARENLDYQWILHYLRSRDIEVISINEPADYSTPMGEFMVSMMGLMATMESRQNQLRVKMGMNVRAKKGLWHGGTPPFGYEYDKKSGTLNIDPKQADAIRAIYRVYLETGCLYKTKKQVNGQGYRYRRDEEWTVPRLRVVLTCKRYTGCMWHGEVEIEDDSIKIIESSDFDRVQSLLKEERELRLPEVVGEEIEQVKHLHLGKKERPPCPQCGLQHAVNVKKRRQMADSRVKTVYMCRICKRYFDDETAYIKIPSCPQCGQQDKVRYVNTWDRDGGAYRVYHCRRCAKAFRTLVRSEYSISDPQPRPAVGAVGV